MKFKLQLHELPKCLEREWLEQLGAKLGRLIQVRSQATHWKAREEVCSMKQRQRSKGVKGEVTCICRNISRVFGATCQNMETG